MLAAVLVTLTAGWVSLLSGVLIPFATGLVTKLGSPKGLKGVLTLILAAAAAIGTAVVQGNGVLESTTLINGLVTLGVSVLWLYNIHLPFNIDAKLLPDRGLGQQELGV